MVLRYEPAAARRHRPQRDEDAGQGPRRVAGGMVLGAQASRLLFVPEGRLRRAGSARGAQPAVFPVSLWETGLAACAARAKACLTPENPVVLDVLAEPAGMDRPAFRHHELQGEVDVVGREGAKGRGHGEEDSTAG